MAEQPIVVPTTMPELGVRLGVETLGALFSTSTLAEEETDDPAESVAVAVQVMVSPTSVSEAVTVYVLPVATLEEPTVQA